MKPLRKLLQHLKYRPLKGDLKVKISGLSYDSRQVSPGGLFACIPGARTDGHLFIEKALAQGAAAIMVAQGRESSLPPEAKTAFSVASPRLALAAIAAEFYDHPSRRLHLTGVTGTNGKSTTVHLLDRIHRAAGFSSGLIGTLGYRFKETLRPAKHTTPEAPDLQALLAEMKTEGITHIAMEVSSHALAQHRADGCLFAVAVFTNLSRDHLDYHADEKEYLAAKSRLFFDKAFVPREKKRVNIINIDDPAGRSLARRALGETVTYGLEAPTDLRATQIAFLPDGTDFLFSSPWGEQHITMPLLGRFNVYNALAALGAALSQGVPFETALAALCDVEPPVGRFQRVPAEDLTIIVDYAHTPDGLEKVLSTARALAKGRLVALFGCGGDRDPGKRPIMGSVVSRLADVVVITSDNPRSENPETIIKQIVRGVPAKHKNKISIEPDRARAIHLAIRQAQPDDLVLLAGKGHETYQILADRTIHFDDVEVAREALQERAMAAAVKEASSPRRKQA